VTRLFVRLLPQGVARARAAVALLSLCLASAALPTRSGAPLPAPGGATPAAAASCARIAARYRGVAQVHPGESPLAVLSGLAGSGVTLSTTHVELHSVTDLNDWARARQPPFELTTELIAALDSMLTHASAPALEQLPGGRFYSISSVAGTASCYEALYFVVDGGRARLSPSPPGFDDEDATCGVRRAFGRVDDAAAFFQELYDRSPRMTSTLVVATWSAAGIAASCRVSFVFAPQFRPEPLHSWRQACTTADCGELQRAAAEVVTQVQQDPPAARRAFEARLSAAELQQYQAALAAAAAARRAPEPTQDPAEISDQQPLQLPYVRPGRVYLLSVGHFTIGWRTFADWSVRFETLADGQLAEQAALAVGMTRGALLEAKVASLPER
jgi:hypothetical protein